MEAKDLLFIRGFSHRSLAVAALTSGKVHVDALELRVTEQVGERLLATEAAMFDAAEGHAREMAAGVIDPDESRFDLPRHSIGSGEVARPDAGREAKLQTVSHRDDFRLVAPGEHCLHRPEDFFLRDSH